MKICGKELSDEKISLIRDIISESWQKSRTQLSRQICETLEWRGPNGRLKDASCRVVLLRLHREGIIQLPEAQKRPSPKAQKCRDSTLKAVVGEIRIIKICSRYSKPYRIWKELMDRYHYLGSGPLCGNQMKYLIESERYGYVWGLAFSSSAWSLEARDKWIGWDERCRRENLSKVVCNSRFLIVPYVRVRNLASHALSMCIQQLEEDWYSK